MSRAHGGRHEHGRFPICDQFEGTTQARPVKALTALGLIADEVDELPAPPLTFTADRGLLSGETETRRCLLVVLTRAYPTTRIGSCSDIVKPQPDGCVRNSDV